MNCLFCNAEISIPENSNNVVCKCNAVNIQWPDTTLCAIKFREDGEETYADVMSSGKNADLAKKWLLNSVNMFLERHLEMSTAEEVLNETSD